jgi:ferritin-like metal-binding protein YciE
MKSTITKMDKKATLKNTKGNSDETNLETSAGCRNIFVEELKEIYFSEKALIISIPILIQNAATDELADALKVHLQFTIDHIKRLEEFFNSIGEKDIMLQYEAMYGLPTPQKTEKITSNLSKK